MSKAEDDSICTDMDTMMDRKIDSKIKPIIIMSACTEERIIKRIDRLEDLVIHKRLFYRKVVLGAVMFMALIVLSGC